MASVVDEILKELEQEQSLPLRPSRGVPPSRRKSPVQSRSIVDELDEEIKTEPPTISQADVIAREIDTDPESLRARTAAGEDLTDAQRKIVFEAERARPLSDMAIGAVKAFVPAAAGMAVQLGKGTVKGTYQGVIKPLAQVAASGLINEPGSAEQEKAIGDAIKGSTGTVRSLASGVAQDINETANSAFRFANFGTSITDLGLEALGMMSKEKSYENYLARLQMRKLEQQDIQDRPDRAAAALQDNPLAGVAINAAASLSGMQPMTADEQDAALRGYKDSLQPETQRKPDEDISAVGEVISPVSLPARLIDPAMGVVGKTLDKTAGAALSAVTKPVIKGLHPVEATGLALRKVGEKSNDLGNRFSRALTGREDSFLRTPTDIVSAFTRKPGELLQGTGRFMRDMGRQIDAGGVRGRRGIIERMGRDPNSGDWVKNTFGSGSQEALEKLGRKNKVRMEEGLDEIKLGTGGTTRAKVADFGLRAGYAGAKSGTVGAMLNGILGAADSETAEEFGTQMGVGFGIGAYGTMNLAGKTQAVLDPRTSAAQKIDAVIGVGQAERHLDEEADLNRFRSTAPPEIKQAVERLTSPEEIIAFNERRLARAEAARAQAISEGKDAADFDAVIATGKEAISKMRTDMAANPMTPQQKQAATRAVELIYADALDMFHAKAGAAGLDNVKITALDSTQYEAMLRDRWGDTLRAAEAIVSQLGPLPSRSPSEEQSLFTAKQTVGAFQNDVRKFAASAGAALSPSEESKKDAHLRRVGVTSPEMVLNIDSAIANLAGESQDDKAIRRSLRDLIQHEGMHVLEDFSEVDAMVQPTRDLAFGKTVKRPDGTEIKSPGMFSDEWILNEGVERYIGYGKEGTRRDEAIANYRANNAKEDQLAYIKREILAELAGNSEGKYGSIRDGLDSVGQAAVDRILVANKNSVLGRMRAALELAGVSFDSRNNPKSVIFGNVLTPQLLASMREYKRRLRDFEGTLSHVGRKDGGDVTIDMADLMSNRALQEAYKDDVIWEKDTTVSVFDDAGTLIAEIPIADSGDANSALDEYRIRNGQLIDEKGNPMAILSEVDFTAFPDGSRVEVDSRIRRDVSGNPIVLDPREVKRRALDRMKLIQDAINNAPDDDSGVRLEDTGNGSYRGSMNTHQVAAIMALPNSLVPPSLKRNIVIFNDLLRRKDGTRVLVEYQPALYNRKYKSLSPKIRDLVPIGFQFTTKGNFLAVNVSISRMVDKMNAWVKEKPDNLNLWGRDTGRFWEDVLKAMSNHQKGLHADGTDTQGRLVGDSLDADPAVALDKKNRINDFFNLYNKATENANPDRTKLKAKRGKETADRVIMSARMDRITQIQVSNAMPIPIDYGKITTNFFPDPSEDDGEDPVAIAFSGDTVVQRGGSDEDGSSIYVVRNNQRVASGYYDRMARDFFFGREQKSFQSADEAAQYFDAVAGSDPTSERPDNFFPGMHYRDVPSDPKVALADFYMLGMLMKVPTTGWSMDSRDKIVGAHGESGVMRTIPRDATGRLAGARLDWFTDSIDEAKEVAIPIMRKRMSDAVWFSVSAELRHFFQRTQDKELMDLPIAQELARALALQTSRPTGVILPEPREQYKMNSSDRVNANAAFNDARKRGGYTRRDVALFAERAFREGKWSPSYGGPKWGDIAAHLAHLEDESIMGETIKTWRDGKFIDTGILSDRAYENMAVAIDRAYDLQHNTGGVLNKLRTYADSSGSYGWIQQMLDFKAAVVNPRELMHLVSPTMRRIATAVFGDTRASNPTLEDAKNNLLKYVTETTASKFGKNAAPYRKMSTDFVESLVAEAKSMVERSGEDSVIKVYKWLKKNYPTPHRELIAKIPVFKDLVDTKGTSAINENSGMHLKATTLTLLDKAFPGMSDKLLEKRFWAFNGDALQLIRMAIVEAVIEKNSVKIKAEAQRIAAKKAADEAAKKKAEEAKLVAALKAEAAAKAKQASKVGSPVIITPEMLEEAQANAVGIPEFTDYGTKNHAYFVVGYLNITNPAADLIGEQIEEGTFEGLVDFWVKEGADKNEVIKALLLFDAVNPGFIGGAIDEHVNKQLGPAENSEDALAGIDFDATIVQLEKNYAGPQQRDHSAWSVLITPHGDFAVEFSDKGMLSITSPDKSWGAGQEIQGGFTATDLDVKLLNALRDKYKEFLKDNPTKKPVETPPVSQEAHAKLLSTIDKITSMVNQEQDEIFTMATEASQAMLANDTFSSFKVDGHPEFDIHVTKIPKGRIVIDVIANVGNVGGTTYAGAFIINEKYVAKMFKAYIQADEDTDEKMEAAMELQGTIEQGMEKALSDVKKRLEDVYAQTNPANQPTANQPAKPSIRVDVLEPMVIKALGHGYSTTISSEIAKAALDAANLMLAAEPVKHSVAEIIGMLDLKSATYAALFGSTKIEIATQLQNLVRGAAKPSAPVVDKLHPANQPTANQPTADPTAIFEKAIDNLLIDDPHTDEHGNVWNLESLDSDIESVTMVELNLNGKPITNAFPLDSETMLPPESDVMPTQSLTRYFKEQIDPDWIQHLKTPAAPANQPVAKNPADSWKEVTPKTLAATVDTILQYTAAAKTWSDTNIDNLTNDELKQVVKALNALLPTSQKVILDSAVGIGGYDFIQFIGADGTKVSVETIPADNAGGKLGVIDSNGIQSVFKFPPEATSNQKFIAGILAANNMAMDAAMAKSAVPSAVKPGTVPKPDSVTLTPAAENEIPPRPDAKFTTPKVKAAVAKFLTVPAKNKNIKYAAKTIAQRFKDGLLKDTFTVSTLLPAGTMPGISSLEFTLEKNTSDSWNALVSIEHGSGDTAIIAKHIGIFTNDWLQSELQSKQLKDTFVRDFTGLLQAQLEYLLEEFVTKSKDDGGGLNSDPLQAMPSKEEDLSRAITPTTLYNFYHIATLESQGRLKSDYAQGVVKEYLDIYKRRYVDAFTKIVEEQIAKYIGRRRTDPGITSETLEAAKGDPAALDTLMQKTFRSDMKRRNDVWNFVTEYLRGLHEAKSPKDIIFFIDRLNNAVHNTDELLFSKFRNAADLLETFDTIHRARDERAYGRNVDKTLRELEDFDKGPTDQFMPSPIDGFYFHGEGTEKTEKISGSGRLTVPWKSQHSVYGGWAAGDKGDPVNVVYASPSKNFASRFSGKRGNLFKARLKSGNIFDPEDAADIETVIKAAKTRPGFRTKKSTERFREDMQLAKDRKDGWHYSELYADLIHAAGFDGYVAWEKKDPSIGFFPDRLKSTWSQEDQFMPSSQELFKGDMLGQREFFKEKLVDSEYDNMREVPHDILQEWSDEWRRGHPRDGSATDGVAFMPSADSNWWVLNRRKQVLWGPMPKAEAENFAPNYLLTDKRPAEDDFTWKLYEPASDDPAAQGIVQAAHQAGMRLFGKDRSGYVRGLDKFSEESADQLPIGEYFPTMSHAFDPANANGAHDISDQEITSKKLEEIQAEDGNIYIASSDGITRYLADQFMPDGHPVNRKAWMTPDGEIVNVDPGSEHRYVARQFFPDETSDERAQMAAEDEGYLRIVRDDNTLTVGSMRTPNRFQLRELQNLAEENEYTVENDRGRQIISDHFMPAGVPIPTQAVLNRRKRNLPKYEVKIEEFGQESGDPGAQITLSTPRKKWDHVATAYIHFEHPDNDEALEIRETFVRPDMRGKYYGEALYREIAKLAQKRGQKFLMSHTVSEGAAAVRSRLFREEETMGGFWERDDDLMLSKVGPQTQYMPDIANQPELESKLSAFLATRRVADKRIKDWFSNHYVKGFLQASQAEGSQMAELKPYKPKKSDPEWKRKSGLQQFLGLSDSERQWIAHATDYMATLPDQELDKLNKQPLSEMQRKVTEWDKKLQKNMGAKAQAVKENTDIKTIARISEEFSIVELVSKKAYEDEGKIMGHCVGENYDPKDKDVRLLSLRGKDQQPHVTLEVVKDLDSWIDSQREIAAEDLMEEMDEEEDYDDAKDTAWELSLKYVLDEYDLKEKELDQLQKRYRGFIVQIKGKGNKAPIEKYAKVVREFLKQNSDQYLILKEGENIGLKNKSEKADALEEAEPDEEPLKSKYKKPVKTRTLEELLDFKLKKERLQGFGGERYFDQYAVTNEGEPIINPDGMPYSSTTWGYNLTEEKAQKHIAAWIRSDFKKKANRNLSSWEGKQTDQMMPSAPYASNAGNSGQPALSDVVTRPVASTGPVSSNGPLAGVRPRVNLGESEPSDKTLPLDKVTLKPDPMRSASVRIGGKVYEGRIHTEAYDNAWKDKAIQQQFSTRKKFDEALAAADRSDSAVSIEAGMSGPRRSIAELRQRYPMVDNGIEIGFTSESGKFYSRQAASSSVNGMPPGVPLYTEDLPGGYLPNDSFMPMNVSGQDAWRGSYHNETRYHGAEYGGPEWDGEGEVYLPLKALGKVQVTYLAKDKDSAYEYARSEKENSWLDSAGPKRLRAEKIAIRKDKPVSLFDPSDKDDFKKVIATLKKAGIPETTIAQITSEIQTGDNWKALEMVAPAIQQSGFDGYVAMEYDEPTYALFGDVAGSQDSLAGPARGRKKSSDQFMPAGKNPRYTDKDGQFDWKLYSEDRKKAIAYLRNVMGISRADVESEEEWKELIRQTMRGK
jgi:hypothetical protein